jgi:acetolactate synthase-1/3 small subunit
LIQANLDNINKIKEKPVHIIVAQVYDRTGIISRISGFFTRRGYNIESFMTSTTEEPGVRQLTFVVKCYEDEVQLLIHQIKRIEEIIDVCDTSGTDALTREVMLIKIRCEPEKNLEILQVCQMSDIKVLGRGDGTVTVEVVGGSQKLDDVERLFKPYGIEKIVRSGPISVASMS